MRVCRDAIKWVLPCILSLFLTSGITLEKVTAEQRTSPGSQRQAQQGVKSGKEGPRPKSAYQKELELRNPEIVKALKASGRPLPKTPAEAQALGSELTSEGYKRLGDSVLLEMLSKRVTMAEVADEQYCAAMWTGTYGWDMAAAPILYLSDGQQRRWAQINVAAQLVEIRNRPSKRNPPNQTEVRSALEKLIKGLRTDDANFLLAAFKTPLNMTAPDQCRATRLYFRRLKQMAPKDALLIFRSSLYD